MINPILFERGGALLALLFGSRVWAQWRTARRARVSLTTPLVDAAILEAAFAPRAGDDPDLLAEMRDTLLHLNRQAYAEEFWGLHTQLTALYAALQPGPQATMRRALVRLLTANDRWLQLLAARTCADLHITEAVPPLRALLEIGAPPRFAPGEAHPAQVGQIDTRYRAEMENALAALS